jgi:glycosyltransferase involved in cell wall biosynthesis
MTSARATIVHVITQLELGGAQQNTLDTCARLDRSRFDVVLLAGPGGILDAVAARTPNLDFRLVRSLVRPIAPLRDRAAFVEVRDHLLGIRRERREPLLVHTHSSKAGIVGRLAARAAAVDKVVHTIHGFGHPALHNPLLRRIALDTERWLAPRTDRFIAVSQANIDEGTRLGLFRTTPVTLIRSGFDLAEFARGPESRAAARAALGLPDAAPVVGMVACLKPQKAPLDFVDIATRVLAARPDAFFVLAGDGELRAALEHRVRSAGLSERFHLLGWRDDVPRVLHALDVFVLTSRWEGLPRAVVQAMAADVPVVANAVDGVTDVVLHEVTGFATPPGEPDAAARRVLQVLGDPALGARLAAAARTRLPEFDVGEMVARQEALYAELLGWNAG